MTASMKPPSTVDSSQDNKLFGEQSFSHQDSQLLVEVCDSSKQHATPQTNNHILISLVCCFNKWYACFCQGFLPNLSQLPSAPVAFSPVFKVLFNCQTTANSNTCHMPSSLTTSIWTSNERNPIQQHADVCHIKQRQIDVPPALPCFLLPS